jgi:hypothetical protein
MTGESAAVNPEEVGGVGAEVGEGEETTTTPEPPPVTARAGPAGFPAKLDGAAVPVGGALALPGRGTDATAAPTEASAAAPNMMIDTTMANPTARLRRDRTCAFIQSPGDWNYGVPNHPLQWEPRDPNPRPFMRRESSETLTGVPSSTRSVVGATTLGMWQRPNDLPQPRRWQALDFVPWQPCVIPLEQLGRGWVCQAGEGGARL